MRCAVKKLGLQEEILRCKNKEPGTEKVVSVIKIEDNIQQMKTAVYPGTFDPITYGHIDVIKKSKRYLIN